MKPCSNRNDIRLPDLTRPAIKALPKPGYGVIRALVAEQVGKGLGYDIVSFDEQGKEKFIGVKTTNASAMTPFYVSPREPAVADQKGARYKLYRVFDFGGNPRVFALEGPLSNRLHLVACAWIAIPKTSSSRSGSVQMGNRRLSSGIYLLRAVRRHMNNSLSAVVYDIVRLGWRLTTTITAYVVVHTGVAKICSATYPQRNRVSTTVERGTPRIKNIITSVPPATNTMLNASAVTTGCIINPTADNPDDGRVRSIVKRTQP